VIRHLWFFPQQRTILRAKRKLYNPVIGYSFNEACEKPFFSSRSHVDVEEFVVPRKVTLNERL